MAKLKLDIETNFTQVQAAETSMEKLSNRAREGTENMNRAFRQSNQSAERFDNTLKNTNEDLRRLGKQAENLNGIGRSFADVTKKAETFWSKLTTMATGFVAGTLVTRGLSKIGEAFTDAIELQKQFEKSIQNLSAITGVSGADLDFYSEQALKLGISVKGGAVAAVEAFKLIGSAKPELLANKEALVQVTEQAILLSQATGLELPDAATRLTDAMNQFGAASDQAGLFVDTLAAGAKFGAAEVPQITEALLKFGAVAKSSNISIQESTAAIELLGEKGLKGAEAGTALRNVFLKLSAVKALPREALNQLKEAGINTDLLGDKTKTLGERITELAKLQGNEVALVKVFGTENVVAAKSIIAGTKAIDGHLPRLEELTKQIGEQGFGAAAEQAAKNMDTLDQALIEAGNQYDNMILSITSGDFGELLKGFVKSASNELKAFATQVSDLGTLFTKDFGALQDKGGDRLIADIASRIAPEQRLAVAKKLNEEIQDINKELQDGLIELTDEEKAQSVEQIKTKSKLVNEILKLTKVQAVAATEITAEGEQNITNETDIELGKRKKLQEDFAKALLDLQKRVQAAQLEQAQPEAKINLQKDFAQQELELYKTQFEKIGKLTNSNFKLSLEQEEQFAFLKNAINIKAAEDLLKIEVDKQNKLAQARAAGLKQTAENLAAEEANAISNVGLTGRPSDLNEADFERIKQQQVLDIQAEFAIKKLELKQASLAAEHAAAVKAADGELALVKGENLAEVDAKKKAITDNLYLVNQKFALENEASQNATAQLINDIQAKRDTLDQKPPFSLQKFLGLTNDDVHNLGLLSKNVTDILDTLLNEQIKSYDKIIQKSQEKQAQIDSEISDLRDQLQSEVELGQEGLANNQDRIRGEIALKEEQAAREKELELKAIEDRKKVQKEKLLLDTIIQGSNMITAATEIYAKAAAATGPASVPIAVAAISAMLTAFVLQKGLALKAINEGNGFEKGGYTGDIGTKEVAGHVHGQEFVSTAETTKKHRGLLDALHEGNKNDYREALIKELIGTGVSVNHNLPRELNIKKDSIRNSESKLMFKQDNSRMEKELKEIKKNQQVQIKADKVKIYLDHNGNLVQKNGSHTSIIRKKQ